MVLLVLLTLSPPAAGNRANSSVSSSDGESRKAAKAGNLTRRTMLESVLVVGGDANDLAEMLQPHPDVGEANLILGGEGLMMRCLIKNPSNDAVRMQVATDPLINFVLHVEEADGGRVPLTRYGRSRFLTAEMGVTNRTSTNIAPGGEYAQTFHLSRLFDLSQAGRYNFWFETSSVVLARAGEKRTVRSRPVQIIVSEDGKGVIDPPPAEVNLNPVEAPIVGPPK